VAVGEVSAEEVAMIYADQDRCSGCAVCVSVCSSDAIAIREGKAAIDQELCNQCEACYTACPEEAILTVLERSLVPDGSPGRAIDARPNSVAAAIAAGVAPAVGAALLYIGREVVPWVTRYVLGAVERKTAEPAERGAVGTAASPDQSASLGAGRRRRRHRGG